MGYSSREFAKDWRFAIETDFQVSGNGITIPKSGASIPYASDGKQEWGDELKKLTFQTAPSSAIINDDHSILAVSSGATIHLFDARDPKYQELGRIVLPNDAGSMAFRPGTPYHLVASSSSRESGEAILFLWDVRRPQAFLQPTEEEIKVATNRAADAAISSFSQTRGDDEPLVMTQEFRDVLTKGFGRPCRSVVGLLNTRNAVTQLSGRLSGSKSQVFSPCGRYLLYMPGPRPHSNGDDRWDICVYSLLHEKDILTLTGHRDVIMWVGYSANSRFIGSVAWDKTARIWDAETGELRHTFSSDGQNWTGAWSPFDDKFAFTCGNGTIYAYNGRTGEEICTFKEEGGPAWQRSIDWNPSHQDWLLVGGQRYGQLIVLDVRKKEIIQKRKLSLEKSKMEEKKKNFSGAMLEVNRVKWLNNGFSLAFMTTGDGSVEVYDSGVRGGDVKRRFAREGTDSYPEDGDGGDEGEVTSKCGYDMEVWSNRVATVDGDGVRIWDLWGKDHGSRSAQPGVE